MPAVTPQAPQTNARRFPRPGEKIKVAQFGLGLIGIESIKLALDKPWLEVVGAVDIDPAKSGRPLADLVGVGGLGAAGVFDSFDALLAGVRPDVVLHTAGSRVDDTFDQIEPMVRAGVSVVSSCEELLYPALRSPDRSRGVDELCRQFGAGVVGTGVNPGFVMDVLPVTLTGVSRSVEAVEVRRVVDASTRRQALQKKIGSGTDPDAFRALFEAGRAGHAGFRESAALICHALGWRFDRLVETCEPVVAGHDIRTQFFSVEKGLTCGIHQTVTAHVAGRTPLVMDLKMYLDAKDPHDRVIVTGEPAYDCLLQGGVAGDGATVAALVNAVPRVLRAGPGLHLMTDLSVPSFA